MGKGTTKGRYICKVGFYDIYASDSMRKVKLEYPDIKYNVYFSRITGKRNYVINLIIHLDDDTKWDW